MPVMWQWLQAVVPDRANVKGRSMGAVALPIRFSAVAVLAASVVLLAGCAKQECGTCYNRPGDSRQAGACVKCGGSGKVSTATAYSTYTCGYCNGTRYMVCPICRGAGFYDDNGNPCALGAGAHPCAACSQTGKVACAWCTNGLRQGGPSAYSSSPCSNCGGTGKCPACSGSWKQTSYAPLIEFGVVLVVLAILAAIIWSGSSSPDWNPLTSLAAGAFFIGALLWLMSFAGCANDGAYDTNSHPGAWFVVGLVFFVIGGGLMSVATSNRRG